MMVARGDFRPCLGLRVHNGLLNRCMATWRERLPSTRRNVAASGRLGTARRLATTCCLCRRHCGCCSAAASTGAGGLGFGIAGTARVHAFRGRPATTRVRGRTLPAIRQLARSCEFGIGSLSYHPSPPQWRRTPRSSEKTSAPEEGRKGSREIMRLGPQRRERGHP